MAKVKFRYVKRFQNAAYWEKRGFQHDCGMIYNSAIMDILSDIQNMCDAGDFVFKYDLKPNKEHSLMGTLRVSVKRASRLVQRPTKMMLVKVVLHKLEDVLDLRW